MLETHISWIVLTGEVAYKIKKPVNLGFLDFTSLDERRRLCYEEVRLNGRLAPELYLGVVPICGDDASPNVCEEGPVLDYAVKMREFPQENQFDHLLERNQLSDPEFRELAKRVAEFHASVPLARLDSAFGTAAQVMSDVRATFDASFLEESVSSDLSAVVEQVRDRAELAFEALRPVFGQRRERGFVRECHGDLHLANVVQLDGHPVVFDCIEFSAPLRWIDVMSDVAFLTMDLAARSRRDLAFSFLDAYLEETGDFGGLVLLPFYQVYRAMVRAKVALLRARQLDRGELEKCARAESARYLATAAMVSDPTRPELMILYGFSGAGKTVTSRELAAETRAVRISSDVERKRLHGMTVSGRSGSGIESEMYSLDATESTYGRLAELATMIIEAGYSAVVDASFLKFRHRERFRKLAEELDVSFWIYETTAPPEILRERITKRMSSGGDASEADLRVLEHQWVTCEPLRTSERSRVRVYAAETV